MAFEYLTRADWNARPRSGPTVAPALFRSLEAHHSATPILEPGAAARAFQNNHLDTQGWNDIFYNWLIHPDGTIVEGRGWGTSAHSQFPRVFVCFIGNYETGDKLTNAAKRSFEQIRAEALRLYPNIPHSVDWHAERSTSACPGDNVIQWLELRNAERWAAAVPVEPPVVVPPKDDTVSDEPELIASRWKINKLEDEVQAATKQLATAADAVARATARLSRAQAQIDRIQAV